MVASSSPDQQLRDARLKLAFAIGTLEERPFKMQSLLKGAKQA
jgi:hypothetical protein